jgi:hypothetical protein
MNDYVALCSCIGRFSFPDGWISTGVVVRTCPDGAHHADTAGLDSRVPADTIPDFRVVLDRIPISGRFR